MAGVCQLGFGLLSCMSGLVNWVSGLVGSVSGSVSGMAGLVSWVCQLVRRARTQEGRWTLDSRYANLQARPAGTEQCQGGGNIGN